MVKCTGRGLVVKRPGGLSKVQMLNLVLGGSFPFFQRKVSPKKCHQILHSDYFKFHSSFTQTFHNTLLQAWQTPTYSAGPKVKTWGSAEKRQESATFVEHIFLNVAVQYFHLLQHPHCRKANVAVQLLQRNIPKI